AGEGLTSAAGHDRLASLGVHKTGGHSVQRGLLMLAQLLLGPERHYLIRLVPGPVDLAVFQGLQVNLADRRLLALQRILCMLAPVIGGGDDNAMRKRGLARGGEETVDVLLLDFVV